MRTTCKRFWYRKSYLKRSVVNAHDITYISQHFVNQSKCFCFHCIQITIPQKVFFNLLPGVTGMFTHQMKQLRLQSLLFAGSDSYILRVALCSTTRGMHVNGSMR